MKAIISLLLMTAFLALQGCAVPGMQLGLQAPGNSQSSGLLSNDISARSDIYVVSSQTIKNLQQVRAQRLDADNKTRAALESHDPTQYRIGAQDVLGITVWEHPELNNPTGAGATGLQGHTVSSDGTIFYPYVGLIQVSGKTVQDVRAFIEKSITQAIRSPQVDVFVQSFRSQHILVSGEVKTPGTQLITDVPLRVADAISASGGLTTEADLNSVTLSRGGKLYPIDLYALLYRGDFKQNYLLQNGDSLNIPDRRFNKVFVLGEISKPSSVTLPRGDYTLTEALADAGGVTQFSANAGQIYVIRAGKDQRAQIYQLNAQSPDALVLADQFTLQSRDVVYVDSADISRFNRVISQLLPGAYAVQTAKTVSQ